MKTTIEIPELIVEKIVAGIMDNFPEASSGCALRCVGWRYLDHPKGALFQFDDAESDKSYRLGKIKLLATFPLILSEKWPKGCTQPPASGDWKEWEKWLCQADAQDFDAFAQLACLGEVIYG